MKTLFALIWMGLHILHESEKIRRREQRERQRLTPRKPQDTTDA